MLETMTDQLKTPLNGIICFVEISKACQEISEFTQNLDIINKNALMLLYQLNSILDYGAILKNTLMLKIEFFNLRLAINEIFEIFIE